MRWLLAAATMLAAAAPASAAPIAHLNTAFDWATPLPSAEPAIDIGFSGDIGYLATTPNAAFDDNEPSILLRSFDGGKSWEQIQAPPSQIEALHAIDASTVVVRACDIWRSADRGRSFARLTLPTGPGRCARSAAFSSAQSGFVLLRDGSVMATANGGASFAGRARVPGVTDATVSAGLLSLPGSLLAFRDGLIYRSTDSGASWSLVAQAGEALGDMTVAAPGVAYAVGGKGVVLRSGDAGASWQQRPLAGGAEARMSRVWCSSAQRCIFLSDRGPLVTSDGGAAVSAAKDAVGIAAVAPLSSSRLLAGTSGAGLAVSEDSGRSFAPQRPVVPGGRLEWASGSTAFSVGSESLGRSQDSGRTWAPVALPLRTGEYVSDASFLNGRVGQVLISRARRSRILTTRDGGNSWSSRPSAGSRLQILVAGPRTTLLASERSLARSANGGRSFRVIRARAVTKLKEPQLVRRGRRLYATGVRRLARSLDGGRRWRRLRVPKGVKRFQIDFPTARTGYLSAGESVYKTTNGGRRWRRLYSAVATETGTVAFTNAREGVVDASLAASSGGEGNDDFPGSSELLRTADGGRTWVHVPIRYGAALNGLALNRRNVIASFYSGIVHSSSAGVGPRRIALTLKVSRKRIRRRGSIVLSGRTSPGVPRVTIYRLTYLGGETLTAKVDPAGRFRRMLKIGAGSRFVAAIDANRSLACAATPALRVRVTR